MLQVPYSMPACSEIVKHEFRDRGAYFGLVGLANEPCRGVQGHAPPKNFEIFNFQIAGNSFISISPNRTCQICHLLGKNYRWGYSTPSPIAPRSLKVSQSNKAEKIARQKAIKRISMAKQKKSVCRRMTEKFAQKLFVLRPRLTAEC